MDKEKVLAKASFYLMGVLARSFSSPAKVKWNWVGFSFSSRALVWLRILIKIGGTQSSNIKDGMSSKLSAT